ncbi:MAG: twin-arginine translocase TatA/TatE family subunit [Deltaproteobacteria bacterium]|nr:twin-arginine translocase TatA/TatE family subunit [Deltaproteobacteria bacterium]
MDQVQLAFVGGLGLPEVLVIGTIAILLFGTKKLPELGKGLARGIKEFKDGLKGEESSKDKSDPSQKS